jgi:outer membrane protein, heavy metal efflux system
MKNYLSNLLGFLVISSGGWAGDCVYLDLETAWERVLCADPALSAAELGIDAQAGLIVQAGLLPNPVLGVVAENLAVSHPNQHTEPPQTTFSLSQVVELGGKRQARRSFAACEKDGAYWDCQILHQNKRLELTTAFISVSVAQEKYKLAQNKREIAEKLHHVVATQLQNGKSSPIDEKKAQIVLTTSLIDEREAYGALEEAKKTLSMMWGEGCPDFDYVAYDLYHYEPPPCREDLLECICKTPDYARAQQALCCAQRAVSIEKANRIPDVVVSVGCRWYNEGHACGWVVGAEMPIPFFDYNQGNVKQACALFGQAGFLRDESLRVLQEEMSVALEHLLIAYDTSVMIHKGLLADATETVEYTQTGYENGKFAYRELLDVQSMLFEIQQKYIDVLFDYHVHRAEIARLSGEI